MLKKLTKKQKTILLIALGVIVLAAGAFALTHSNKATDSAVYPESPTEEQAATEEPGEKQSTTGGSSGGSTETPTSNQPISELSPPQGQASHTVVSKSADAQAENSPSIEVTCLTSAANGCVLRLTSPTGQVSTIPNSYNDKQGNFIFNFNAKSYATGSWKMQLIATRDGKEAATNIGPLEVTP